MKHSAKTAAAIAAAVAVLAGVAWFFFGAGTDTRGAEVMRFEVESEAVPGKHPAVAVIPGDPATNGKRGLLMFLHGRNGDSGSFAQDAAFLAALAKVNERTRGRAPIVVFPDGGDSSYWHDRSSGDWGRYLIDEVIPQAAERTGADPSRVVVGGISMGGFGALNLAQRNPGRFCGAGGHSPALFRSAGETPQGAFDDAPDFERNDVIGTARRDPSGFAGAPIWLDAGREDFFHPTTAELTDVLDGSGADLTARLEWPGGHDDSYWDAHWAQYLGFYTAALRDCTAAGTG